MGSWPTNQTQAMWFQSMPNKEEAVSLTHLSLLVMGEYHLVMWEHHLVMWEHHLVMGEHHRQKRNIQKGE